MKPLTWKELTQITNDNVACIASIMWSRGQTYLAWYVIELYAKAHGWSQDEIADIAMRVNDETFRVY